MQSLKVPQKPRLGRPVGSTKKAKFDRQQIPLFIDAPLFTLKRFTVGDKNLVLVSFWSGDHE